MSSEIQCQCGMLISRTDDESLPVQCPACGHTFESLRAAEPSWDDDLAAAIDMASSMKPLSRRADRVNTRCPHCGEKQARHVKQVGKETTCSVCAQPFVVKRLRKKESKEPAAATPDQTFGLLLEHRGISDRNVEDRTSKPRPQYNLAWDHVARSLNRLYWGVFALHAALLAFFGVLIGLAFVISWVAMMQDIPNYWIQWRVILLLAPATAIVAVAFVFTYADQYVFETLGYLGFVVLMTCALGAAPALIVLVMIACGVCIIAGTIWILIGLLFCLRVPPESGARGLIQFALLALLGVVVTEIVLIVPVGPTTDLKTISSSMAVRIGIVLTFVLGTCAHVLVVLFLRKIPVYFQDRSSIDHISGYLWIFAFATLFNITGNAVLLPFAHMPLAAMLSVMTSAALTAYVGMRFLSVIAAARDIIRP